MLDGGVLQEAGRAERYDLSSSTHSIILMIFQKHIKHLSPVTVRKNM